MPQFSRALDIYQGYNFKKDAQTACGFITAMQIGNAKGKLEADQTICNLQDPANTMQVVAVLSHVYWGTGLTDAIYFSGQVSAANKKVLAAAILNDLTEIAVNFSFQIHEYDPGGNPPAYFASFHGGDSKLTTEMKGLLEKNGSDLNLSVADSPSTEVQSPLNYSFQIGIKCQPIAKQAMTISVSATGKIPKPWGVKLGSK